MAVVFHLVYIFFLGSDKLFPAFGFGAQVPPDFKVRCSYFLKSNINLILIQVILYYLKDVKLEPSFSDAMTYAPPVEK